MVVCGIGAGGMQLEYGLSYRSQVLQGGSLIPRIMNHGHSQHQQTIQVVRVRSAKLGRSVCLQRGEHADSLRVPSGLQGVGSGDVVRRALILHEPARMAQGSQKRPSKSDRPQPYQYALLIARNVSGGEKSKGVYARNKIFSIDKQQQLQ